MATEQKVAFASATRHRRQLAERQISPELMPIGPHGVSRRLDEETVLAAFERAGPWAHLRAPGV